MRLRRTRLAAVLVLVAAGCAIEPGDSIPGSAPPSTTGTATSPAGAPAIRADVDEVGTVDPQLLRGVQTATVSDERRRIDATWFEVPGAPWFSTSLGTTVARQVAAYRADWHSVPGAGPDQAAPELNITPSVVGSSPDAVGVRLSTYEFAGADGASSYRISWFDPHRRRSVGTRGLFSGTTAYDAFRRLVVERLRRVQGVDTGTLEQNVTDEVLDAVSFDRAGGIAAELDEYSVGPGSLGVLVVPIGDARVAPLLSDFGRRARAAAVRPRPVALGGGMAESVPVATTSADRTTVVPRRPVDCRVAKCVALTFDDGPGPYTEKLLGILARRRTRATFFVLGRQGLVYPKLVAMEAAAGHEIGNHTTTHRQLTGLGPAEIRAELERTDAVVRKVVGHAPRVMRPPYGAHNKTVDAQIRVPIILWDVDTLDWKTRSTRATVDAVRRDARRGSIILVHDIHKSTVAAVPAIVDDLKARGFTLVTVSELLRSKSPKPGVAYRHGPR